MARVWLLVLVCLLSGGLSQARAQPAAHVPKVGDFSLVVGEVVRVDAAGKRHLLRTGDALQEQDRLITGPDALAMVVFVDKARLAIRPDTELVVRRYRIDASGAQTKLEFDLVRGTVRQISGEAARQQPDRYRLNTPIAVIGVRGTDFLARATERKLETYIHEGMIVLMAARADCPAVGCPVLASSSAGDAGRLLQMSANGAIERSAIMPEDVERIFGIRVLSSPRDGSVQIRGTPSGSALASVAQSPSLAFAPLIFSDPNVSGLQVSGVSNNAGSIAASGANAGANAGAGGASSAGGTATGSTSTVATPGTSTTLVPAGTGSGNDTTLPVVMPVPLPTTLVWGRFTDSLQIPLTMTESYDSARQGRHVTVGELGQYALWRNNPGGTLNPALSGKATFGLALGQAFYRTESATVSAVIESARLTADFDLSTFSTELKMNAGSGGPSTLLSASGRINDEGLFLSLAPDGSQRVAGAFSRNGLEAGYLFNKIVGSGVFQGVTLWGIRR